MRKKKATSPEDLCSGFPNEFCSYIQYTRALAFEQNPDYEYLRGLLRKVLENNKYVVDYEYDWDLKNNKDKYSKGGTLIPKNTLNNTNNNNILLTNVSNQPEYNIDSFRGNDKKGESDNNNNPLFTSNNVIIPQNQDEGNISKPNKFVVNETKNKFDNHKTLSKPDPVPEFIDNKPE